MGDGVMPRERVVDKDDVQAMREEQSRFKLLKYQVTLDLKARLLPIRRPGSTRGLSQEKHALVLDNRPSVLARWHKSLHNKWLSSRPAADGVLTKVDCAITHVRSGRIRNSSEYFAHGMKQNPLPNILLLRKLRQAMDTAYVEPAEP